MTTTATATGQILIVEDDRAIYHAMQLLLRHYEYDVRLATTLAEARQQLDPAPDFVLLDVCLPDGTSDSLFKEIVHKKLSTKVIVITACDDPVLLRSIAQFKPELMLRKPINFFDLLNKLKPVL